MAKRQFLGWGLVGTPKGRQQISAGVTLQLNTAEQYDLPQEIGACLPSPQLKNYDPLYCFKWRKVGQHNVLGLAEYLSIFEQGQTRAGTYFGSFVEVVNHAFSPKIASLLIDTEKGSLWTLNLHQFDHFIDENTASYHTVLRDKSVPALPYLNNLAEGLIELKGNALSQTVPTEDLYIACKLDETARVLAFLIESQLYYQYKNIYFSGNTHINQKIANLRIKAISFAQLQSQPLFVQPFEKEIGYLHSVIQRLQQSERTISTQFQQFKANQDKYVDEQVTLKSTSYIQQVDSYKQQAEGYKQMAAQAQKQTQDAQFLAELGKTLVETVGQKAEQLGNVNLARFAPVQQSNKTEQMLINIDSSIKKLSMDLANSHSVQQVEVEKEVVKKSPWTVIWAGFSGLLFMILLGILITRALSSDDFVTKEAHNELKDENIRLETTLQSEKTKLQRQIEGLEQEIKQLKQEKENLQSKPSQGKSNQTGSKK